MELLYTRMFKEYMFDFRNKKKDERIFGVRCWIAMIWLHFQSKPDRTQHAYNKTKP